MLRRSLATTPALRLGSSILQRRLAAAATTVSAAPHVWTPRAFTATNFADQIASVFTASGQASIVDNKKEYLSGLKSELARLNATKEKLDAQCGSLPDNIARGTFGYLVVQSTVLCYWVYSRFDWCLCEPITYLLGTAVVWIALGFYIITGGDYDWDVLRQLMIDRQRKKLYAASKLDVARIELLKDAIDILEHEIGEVEGQ